MKFLKLTILAAVVMSLTYCTKEELKKSVAVSFTGPKVTFDFALDTTSVIKSVSKDTTIATVNLDSLATANNTTVDEISKIGIESMTIYCMYPSTANFDILDTIKLFLTSPTLPNTVIQLADVTNITPGAKTINPPIPTGDLLGLLKQKKIRLYGTLANKKKVEIKSGYSLVFKTKITAGGN